MLMVLLLVDDNKDDDASTDTVAAMCDSDSGNTLPYLKPSEVSSI